jgi:hypothetical protein
VYDAEHEYGSPPALGDARLLDVACARAACLSWEAAVSRLNLTMTPDELRRACLGDPRYDELYDRADRDPDPAARARAQERLGLHLRAKGRDATRPEVEAIRADVQRARIAAQARRDAERAAKAPPTPEQQRAGRERLVDGYARQDQLYEGERMNRPHWDEAARQRWTPEEYADFVAHARVITAKYERERAADVSRWGKVVYVWGGRHPIGGHPPGEGDTPVYLLADHTCAAELHQSFYWAIPDPPPTDPEYGPFPPPGPPPEPGVRSQESGHGGRETERKPDAMPDATPG